jgi:phage shock protein C
VADRLYRSRDDRMLAGVAGGVAEEVDVDPSIIRIVWVLLVFLTGGLALLVYIVMAIVVPERPAGLPIEPAAPPLDPAATGPGAEGSWRAPDGSIVPLAASGGGPAPGAPGAPGAPAGRRARRDPADRTRIGLLIGLLLIVLGSFFLIRRVLPSLDLWFWWPLLAIGAGVLLLIFALLPPRRSR